MPATAIQPDRWLAERWSFAVCAPGSVEPRDLSSLSWLPAHVPGTVAENLGLRGLWNLGDAEDLDAREYWFRCEFAADTTDDRLAFDGLATLADVWLNGTHILHSDNMFLAHTVKVAEWLRPDADNVLLIRFSSLAEALNESRPRARWRTRLAAHRNLRFFRTLLLGRTPGIYPPVAAIGPWRGVRLGSSATPQLLSCEVRPRIEDRTGVVTLSLRLASGGSMPKSAHALLDGVQHDLALQVAAGIIELAGRATVEAVEPWWPHTHGAPTRYPLGIVLTDGDGVERRFDLAPIGFRTLGLAGDLSRFELLVNGHSIHCRGGCWMPPDLITLRASRATLRSELTLLRDAGMNMVRLSGISLYESDDFYDLCDELGLLVWQDFPFASLDYPTDDAAFLASIEAEARQFLAMLGHRPCLAVTCGGSEIQQQVTMLGLPCALADSAWFDDMLPALVREARPDVLHCPHSPTGGILPFYADEGVSHYFGVGGYRRPVDFAALEPPRFATECLAFAIPPGPTLLESEFEREGAIDLPQIESRHPRDNGSSWHFGEVTDHYLVETFAVDAAELKARDPRLYLAAAAIAVGETMQRVAGIWRANGFTHGALIWTLRDVWPGAGWGVVDSAGEAKAPYYFLKRAWQPITLTFVDRGINGLRLRLHNDSAEDLAGMITVRLCRRDGQPVQQADLEVQVERRASREWSVDALLGGFVDSSYAYRFGPPAYEVAAARFESARLPDPLTAHHVLEDHPDLTQPLPDPGLTWELVAREAATAELRIRSAAFVRWVVLECPGCRLSDNYFALPPGEDRFVRVSGVTDGKPIGTLGAFNGPVRLPLTLPGTAHERR